MNASLIYKCMSREERTSWRDKDLSKFLREIETVYGVEAPACDCDWLLYNLKTPVALIDFKREGIPFKDCSLENANILTQSKLATLAGIPFWVCCYSADLTTFVLHPRNPIAHSYHVLYGLASPLRLSAPAFAEWNRAIRERLTDKMMDKYNSTLDSIISTDIII